MFEEMFQELSLLNASLITALIAVIFVCFVLGIVLSIKKKSFLKPFFIIAISIVIALAISVIIVSMIDTYKDATIDVSSEIWLYVCTLIIVAIIVVLTFLFGKKIECNHTKSIVYGALCIAMSFALSYVRLFELPQGGSVTLASLLPMIFYSYAFGIRKGVGVGVIYGFLQFIQAPWLYHPVQFLLDYPIAFASIGLSGLFYERKILDKIKPVQLVLSVLVAVTLRYLAHVISGIFVFGSADPENYSAVAWSFLYNAFAYVDIAITLVVGCALFASKSFVKLIENARK